MHCLKRQYNACDNRKKQCRPNETKPNSNALHPRKTHNIPTNTRTPKPQQVNAHTPHVHRDAAACTR